jgi:hypothetical protein
MISAYCGGYFRKLSLAEVENMKMKHSQSTSKERCAADAYTPTTAERRAAP